ncbi:MAG: hypothetical protein V4638_06340 [Bacteroidota bacterium]
MKNLLSIFFLVFTTVVFGQHTNFNTQKNWSLNKKEVIFGIGASQFTGDLGGRDRIGKDYSLVDIDLPSTGISGMLGYRFRFHPMFATSTTVNFMWLRGNDAMTNEIIRNSRNLHFRSFSFEIQQRIEFIIYANEKFGARYKLPGHKYFKDKNFRLYVYTGAGALYYNPQAQYQGDWVNLKGLNTEGQGMTGGPKKYLGITATIPFGIGFRMGLGQMWRMGIEATYIKTFSDYIDDVGGVYYDPAALGSPAAAYLSNPASQNATWFAPGQVRGQKQKDAYYTLNIVFARNLTYKNNSKQRRMYQFNRGRYKF